MQMIGNRLAKWFILAGLCLVVSGCGTKTYKEVPDQVMGVWKTTAAKYGDRYFELKKDSIVFGQGGHSVTTYSITNIKVKDAKLYKIEYVGGEGQAEQWEFTYDPETNVLRLKSQNLIEWRKAS
jgi:hypothetical protein